MVTIGIDRLLSERTDLIEGKTLGLITNPSGVTADLTPTIDALYDHPDADLRVLFGPEHGVRGDHQAGEKVADATDGQTGLPVKSLYGESRRLDPSTVDADLDAVLFDIQPIGCRFYTYLYTLAYAMEGLAGSGVEMIVLDRPNPISPLDIDGNRIPNEHASFVGNYRLPILYDLTIGEFSHYVADEFDVAVELTVVELDDWDRGWYDETDLPWVPPSPNIPTLDSATLYPGVCFIEGTTLSEGRGTTKPFELVGAPWIDRVEWAETLNDLDLPGVQFRPETFRPSFSKHEDEQVEGVQIHLRDRDAVEPVQVGLSLLVSTFAGPKTPEFREVEGYHLDRLAGGSWLRERLADLEDDVDVASVVADIRDRWADDIAEFAELRETYRLY